MHTFLLKKKYTQINFHSYKNIHTIFPPSLVDAFRLLGDTQIDQSNQAQDTCGNHGQSSSVAPVLTVNALAEEVLIDVGHHNFGLAGGTAVGQSQDQVGDLQRTQDSVHQNHLQHGAQQGQGDGEELTGVAGAVDFRSLVHFGRNGLQAGHEEQHVDTEVLPDGCDPNGGQSSPAVGEPLNTGATQSLDNSIDDTALMGEQVGEDNAHDSNGDHGGHEVHAAEERNALDLSGQQECQNQSQRNLHSQLQHCEEEGVGHGHPVLGGTLENTDEVVKAYETHGAVALVAEDTVADDPQQRDHHEEDQAQNAAEDHQVTLYRSHGI